jgi:lysophospholipid acyltransferase (LPLAT)-like uncharacterized protein
MKNDYYITAADVKAVPETAADRLNTIKRILSTSNAQLPVKKQSGRNLLTRSLDWFFGTARYYLPQLYKIGAAITAFVFFLYARLVALTVRLVGGGDFRWPDIPTPCVLALWHGDAPSLLVAFAKRRAAGDMAILISFDPRGDFLALLCRLLGFTVVRGGGTDHSWELLINLAHKIEEGAGVFLTADGGGSAHVVKVGALALASATRVPLVMLGANCHPAIGERHKWDAARNPVPFGKVAIVCGPARTIESLSDLETIEENWRYLQSALEQLSIETREFLDHPD